MGTKLKGRTENTPQSTRNKCYLINHTLKTVSTKPVLVKCTMRVLSPMGGFPTQSMIIKCHLVNQTLKTVSTIFPS